MTTRSCKRGDGGACATIARLCLLAALFTSSPSAYPLGAHKSIGQYTHEIWNSNNGLPETDVLAILQTRDGYLWLGTEEGLARFDGAHFTVFDRKTTPLLADNRIQALAETPDGSLWIGTENGLSRLKDRRFTMYTTREGLPNNDIRALWTEPGGVLWITTMAGVRRWQNEEFHLDSTVEGISGNSTRQILRGRNGDIWLATDAGLKLVANRGTKVYTPADGLRSKLVSVLLEDSEGTLWIGTSSGLHRLSNGRIVSYPLGGRTPHPEITSLCEDRDGNLWVGTLGDGLIRVNKEGITHFSTADGLSDITVKSLYEDRDGNLWVGTFGGGLNEFRDPMFTPYGKREGISQNVVWTVMEGRDSSIWIGTQAGGLNRLKNGKVTAYPTRRGFTDDTVGALFEGRDGTLWLGKDSGLSRFQQGKVVGPPPTVLPFHERVHAIYEDPNGSVWIGTRSSGLALLKDGKYTFYGTREGLPNNNVQTVIGSKNGGLWIGTLGGLSRFKDGRFVNFSSKDGLSADQVISLYEDVEGTLWIGADGLNRLKNGKITVYTDREGLFDQNPLAILEDDRGYLWMSTNKGIFRVAKQELNDFAEGKTKLLTPVAYGSEDGMRSAECNGGSSPAGWKDHNGNLWFGTLAGVVRLDPRRTTATTSPLQVHVEDMWVDKKYVDPTRASRLPPGGHELEFHYNAPYFGGAGRVHFQYKLEGFDKEWVAAGTRNAAYYTNIPPGKYRFRVAAYTVDGTQNEAAAAVDFYLTPHFYQTYWFLALCILASLLLGRVLWRFRVRVLTAQKENLERLVQMRTQEAEAANRAKSQFLACMSHEIRTPLNGVIGMTDLALATELTLEQREYLEIIKLSGDALLAVICDILDFSKIEAGKIDLEVSDFNLRDCLEATLRTVALRADEKKLELLCDIAADVPETVQGDSNRLRQIVLNLISNAIKFTEAGEVALKVGAEATSGHVATLHLVATDTGIGIPPERQKAIFDPFTQANASTTRKYGGTGLGLTISARLVEAMGGRIWLESEVGQGTQFHFTVQMKIPEAEGTKSSADILPQLCCGARVLVVDDNAASRQILQSMLNRWKLRAAAVAGGQEALGELSSAWEAGDPYALLLIDSRMPIMDGFTVLERAQQSLSVLPILMLSPSSCLEEAKRCRELGVNAYLVKPIRQAELREAIARSLGAATATRSGETLQPVRCPGGDDKPGRSMRVLVAEDNVVNQRLVMRLLEKDGHRPGIVANGQLALDALEQDAWDLVLMDVEMPEMDGLDATARLREKEKTSGKHQLVIGLSAHATTSDKERCFGRRHGRLPNEADSATRTLRTARPTPQSIVAPAIDQCTQRLPG